MLFLNKFHSGSDELATLGPLQEQALLYCFQGLGVSQSVFLRVLIVRLDPLGQSLQKAGVFLLVLLLGHKLVVAGVRAILSMQACQVKKVMGTREDCTVPCGNRARLKR